MREEELTIAGLRVVSVGEPETAEQVVVLLHGFQMQPSDLSPFAHALKAPAWFLFPEGPLPAEPQGRAWWHIDHKAREAIIANGPRDFAGQHPPDLPNARDRLRAFVEALAPRIGGRPFVLGGFSQGAMLTSDTVLRSTFPLSALVLFSGSRIGWDEQEPLYRAAAERYRGLPVMVAHGETDPDIAYAAGQGLRDALRGAGADVTWQSFPQGHEIPLVVWRTFRKFLGNVR